MKITRLFVFCFLCSALVAANISSEDKKQDKAKYQDFYTLQKEFIQQKELQLTAKHEIFSLRSKDPLHSFKIDPNRLYNISNGAVFIPQKNIYTDGKCKLSIEMSKYTTSSNQNGNKRIEETAIGFLFKASWEKNDGTEEIYEGWLDFNPMMQKYNYIKPEDAKKEIVLYQKSQNIATIGNALLRNKMKLFVVLRKYMKDHAIAIMPVAHIYNSITEGNPSNTRNGLVSAYVKFTGDLLIIPEYWKRADEEPNAGLENMKDKFQTTIEPVELFYADVSNPVN